MESILKDQVIDVGDQLLAYSESRDRETAKWTYAETIKKIYKKFLAWFMTTKLYKWSLKSVIPYIRFTMYYASLRGWKYHQMYKELSAGDIILIHPF